MPFDPKKIRYGGDGIPVFTSKEIEEIAYEVLAKYSPKNLIKPGMAPVAEILQGLIHTTGMNLAWEDLGFKGTAKILGKVNFARKTLYLDPVLDAGHKAAFRFTAAHEIGHWVLHRYNWRNFRLEREQPAPSEIYDDEKSLCKLDQRTPRDWLEFHANVFAASLVMPRKPFPEAVIAAQQSMGIIRNLGHVYRDDTEYSQRDFQSLITKLALTYGVSRTAVEVRLRTLNLMTDAGRSSTQTAAQAIAASLSRIHED